MNLTIERIILHNFKGLKHENLLLNNSNVTISGANGSGKSSIECGWFWLMADCSESLVSNPAVFPLDMEEATPSVEVVAVVDGKHITLERRLTRTVKKSKVEGVADAVIFSSTYLVNSVEYGLRDFKQKIAEYGITDKFLTLSHPDMFLSGKKDEMRKVLFGMVSDVTDFQIAQQMDGVDEATELLKNYTFDEVQSMQKASLRKIREVYGKDGELLRARISGLEEAKVDIDFSALELQKNMLKEQIEKNQDAQRIGNLILGELDGLRKKQMELQFELSDLVQKKENEKNLANEKAMIERKSKQDELNTVTKALRMAYDDLRTHDGIIEFMQKEVNKYAEKVEQIKARAFDDSSTVCPVCNRIFESERVEELKKHFEDDKKSKLEEANSVLDSSKKDLECRKPERNLIEVRIKQLENSKAALEKALSEPLNVSESTNDNVSAYQPEIDRLNAEIESVNKLMESKKSSMPNMANLSSEELNLQGELRDCEIQLSKSDDNSRIDSQIEELQRQQVEFEQNIANNEKVLYQLDLILRKKHEVLSDSINKHFKLVKWQFWEFLKNGELRDTVVAKVNGKPFDSSLNTAMQIRAKLDIIQGLQNFYNEFYPVMLDSSEMLDSNSLSLIDMPCQMVYLKVGENKELFVNEI